MRLRRLDLEKFAHFTDTRLDFRSGARLHVVFGANEAGKSCALAAVHGLLYGLPERTTYDFLHRSAELRIGGTIEARDGRRLAFRRRKGRKRVLFDEAGAELPDDTLQAYLGGLGEDVFARAFGLDADGLRKGARELMASRGDVGESLMAASGLPGLSSLRKGLEEDAEKLFAPRASKDRLIYQILERHTDARKLKDQLELGAGKWKKLNDDIADHDERLQAIAARQREALTRLNQLTRLAGLRPLMGRIDADASRLASLGALPDVRAGFGAELAAAIERAGSAAAAVKRGEEALRDITAESAAIPLDAGLVAHGQDILAQFSRIEAYRLATRDLPRVQTESAGFDTDLAEKASALGLADANDIEASLPAAAAQTRIAALITSGADIDAGLARNAEALAAEQEALRRLDDDRKARGSIADPGPLREKFAAFGDVGAKVERVRQDTSAIERALRGLGEEAARLSPPVRDLDAMASTTLPAAAAMARFRKEGDAAAEAARDAHNTRDRLRVELTTLEARLAELSGDGPVPSPETIGAVRRERDLLWKPVRAAAFGEADAPHGAALASAVARFETAAAAADRVADEGARNATRVAAWASAKLALADKQRQTDAGAGEAATSQARVSNLHAEWVALWASAGIQPLPPAEMVAWLSSLGALLQQRDKLLSERAQLDAGRADLEGLDAPLAALAADAGLPPLAGLDLGRQATRVAERIRALAEPWDAARSDARAAQDTRQRIARIARELDGLVARESDWRTQWEDAMRALNLRPAAGLEEARAALDIWAKTPALLRERKNRVGRMAGMKRDLEAFDAAVARIVGAVAADLACVDAAAAIEALHQRLSAARDAEVRHGEIARQQAAAAAGLARARIANTEADKALADLAARLPTHADLGDVADRLAKRDEISGSIDTLRAQFVEQSGQGDATQLRAELAAFDVDGAEAERAHLDDEIKRLNAQAMEIYAEKDRLQRQRADWERGVGAEVAAQQCRGAEAELREAGREWAVLKIGALLLDQALATHRATQRDPLMQRASAFFATLTGGRFSGIGEIFGDDGEARLAGLRSDGKPIPIEPDPEKPRDSRSPLSTGTLDQLYLALRLAYIEDYCSRAEPVPFIGDDLFTSFDDARTGFGVDALAGLSARTQMILFTHHRHVVDIARERLGDGLDVIDLN